MIDHLSFAVNDMERARAFYDAALAPLGYARVMDFVDDGKTFSGYGPPGKPAFWIYAGYGRATPGTGAHTAFLAPTRTAVDAFHREALASGGGDDGKPGLRPEYHANYYAAFVLDPDRHRIEAVCHAPGAFADQFESQ